MNGVHGIVNAAATSVGNAIARNRAADNCHRAPLGVNAAALGARRVRIQRRVGDGQSIIILNSATEEGGGVVVQITVQKNDRVGSAKVVVETGAVARRV